MSNRTLNFFGLLGVLNFAAHPCWIEPDLIVRIASLARDLNSVARNAPLLVKQWSGRAGGH